MKKFILISFGFLGWTFYEMSGGDEFEPASVRLARLNPAVETIVAEATAQPSEQSTTSAFVDTDPPLNPEVTRVSLNLSTIEEVLRGDEPVAAQPQPAEETAEDDIGVPRNVGTLTESADTPAIIPSLLAPVNSDGTNQLAALQREIDGDIRTVSGNRVNVRGGPGTEYDVVGRLVRGDSVEILEDAGNGWVRMRPMLGGEEGWMADFLLTSG